MTSSKKKLINVISSVTAVILLCVVMVAAFNYFNEQSLESFQNEALEELEMRKGQYDDHSIVLQATTKVKAEKLAKLFGAELRITNDGRYAKLTLPEDVTIRDIYSFDENREYIKEMSADYKVGVSELEESYKEPLLPKEPTDFSDMGFNQKNQPYLNYLNFPYYWTGFSGSGLTVAIIDTGIDTDHNEFTGRISEYSYNATEDKIVKDYILEDGSYDWSLIEDEYGHGTSVAGVLAANSDSGNMIGIVPEVEILVIKAEIDEHGFFNSSDLVFGIYYAIERDVSVINMSFSSESNPYAEALKLAYDSDIICVASAGNDGSATFCYPAADEHVIGVGALTEDGWTLADYSNYGESVNLVAPGTTYTAEVGGGYRTVRGTSLAAPIVAGAIVAYRYQDYYGEYLTFEQITEVLYASCTDLGALGKDFEYGFGVIDFDAFLQGEKGTVTYDFLTDELKNIDKTFIRGKTLQEFPQPERLYAVFDGWYYDSTCTEPVEYYVDEFQGDITLYAKWVNEDDTIPFTYQILDDGTIEILSYTGHRRFITVPEKIEGRVVSSIGANAFRGQTKLREVILPSGITNIGDFAFYGCSNLSKIEIPENVKKIGAETFKDNVRLSTVSFTGDSKLELIGSGAFSSCVNLSRIDIPKRVEVVSDFVFEHCKKLTYVTLGSGLTSINGSAFYNTPSLYSIKVNEENKSYTSVDGVLYTYDKGEIVAYPASRSESYTINPSTEKIGDYAFAFTNSSKVDINNATEMGRYAFAYSKISEINFAKVRAIGESCFSNAYLKKALLPDTVHYVGEGAFSNNTQLNTVILGRGIDRLSKYVFSGCSSLEEITIPNTITEIANYAFNGAGLTSVKFEENSSLSIIESWAFAGCKITELDIPDSLVTIGARALSLPLLERVSFGKNSNLKNIYLSAFEGCINLEEITLPNGLEHIGSFAFKNSGILEITIPASVNVIDSGAFSFCPNLTNIYVEEGNKFFCDVDGVLYDFDKTSIYNYPASKYAFCYTVESTVQNIMPYTFAGTKEIYTVELPQGLTVIDEYAFHAAGMGAIPLPDSIVEIKAYAFSNCSNLYSLHIPDNVIKIENYAFRGSYYLSQITFGENSKLSRLSFASFAYSGIYEIIIPKNVSTMAQYVFAGCENLYSVVFADGSKLESISAYTFSGCEGLAIIRFGKNSSLKSIQAHALEGVGYLYEIDLEHTQLTNIDNYAFRFCRYLSSVCLPDTLENIGRYAFYGCSSLYELTIPEAVEHIGSYAFLGTSNVQLYFRSTVLPRYLDENWDRGTRGYAVGVESVVYGDIYNYAILTTGGISILNYFGSDTVVDLTNTDFGAPVVSISGSAFKDTCVESIILPEGLIEIQAEAFTYCNLKSITIPSSVNFIGREAFAYTSIESLTFAQGANIKVIEQYAFTGTKKLKNVTLPKTITTLGTGVFYESGLESVIFEDGILITEIPERAFAYTKLSSVCLPDSVTLVNHNAFNGVSTLKNVSFGQNDDMRIMSNAFYLTGIEKLHIPANLTFIGEYALVGLTDLKEFTIDQNNPSYIVVDGAILTKDGRKLVTVPAGKTGSYTVPLSVETIGFGAFEESKLSKIEFHKDTNILTFGYRAFFKANGITEITIPKSVVSIDYYAFGYCENLKKVTFKDGNKLRGIYEGAFCGNVNLEDILVPETVAEISDYAFFGCSKLNKLPFNENTNVQGIYDYAFAYSGLEGEFTPPVSLIDIGNYAFMSNDFTKIVISDENKKQLIIGLGAFEKCNKLEEITLPFIGASFENDDISWFGYIFGAGSSTLNNAYLPAKLKTVTITEGITYIGDYAFSDCRSFSKLNLPESVSVIRQGAFGNTYFEYELKGPVLTVTEGYNGEILYETENGHFGQGICGVVTLSDDVEKIKFYTFSDCSNLKGVYFSDNITSIDDGVFSGCKNLEFLNLPSITSIGSHAFSNCESLSGTLRIAEGVTSIGTETFYNCKNIDRIELPDSITSIGYNAFYGCTKLTDVNIPSGVSYIGYSAFAYCESLSSVTIPESLTSIAENTFQNCIGLKEVKINNGVTSIGDYAFQYCENIESINIPDSITDIGYAAFEYCYGIKNLTIGDGLTEISDRAFFYNKGLKTVTFGNNVKTIGNHAFYECSNLININFSESITKIGEYTFYGCNINSLTLPSNIKQIGEYAFSCCHNLQVLTIPEGLEELSNGVFLDCEALYKVYNNSSLVLNFGSVDNGMAAFYARIIVDKWGNQLYREDLNGVEYIYTSDNFVFTKKNGKYCLISYNGDEKTITLPETIEGQNYDISYFKGTASKIIVPESITEISENAFRQNGNITDVTFLGDLSSIGDSAFHGCSNLANVKFNGTVGEIRTYAFFGCAKLEFIDLPEGLISIGYSAFSKCDSLQSISFPESLTEVGSEAFEDCQNLSKVTLNKNVEFSNTSFMNCPNLYEFIIPDDHVAYVYRDGIVYNKDITEIKFVFNSISGDITLPDTLTSILDHTFYGCNNLTGITIPKSVSYIGKSAFENCISLTNVTLSQGITSIESSVFLGCTSLTNITIPKGVTSIGYSAFSDCTSLTNITIPKGVTSIGSSAFSNCTSLKSITLPNGITSIESSAFWYCTSLTSITIPEGVTEIQWYAFSGCSSLTSITLPESLTYMESSVFYNCTSLESITIPSGIKTIPGSCFEGCTSLKTVILKEGIETIEFFAFRSCESIENIALPRSIKEISHDSFYMANNIKEFTVADGGNFCYANGILYNKAMTEIIKITVMASGELILPDTLTSIDVYAFMYCERITSIVIGKNVSDISIGAFSGMSNLEKITVSDENEFYCSLDGILYDKPITKILHVPQIISGDITIPNGVTTIQYSDFWGKHGITSVVIPDSVTAIKSGAFSNCSSLKSITLPEGLSSIENQTFYNCYSLSTINLPNSLTYIGSEVFGHCGNLKSITIPENVTSIMYSAFNGCWNLYEVYNNSSLDILPGGYDHGQVGYYAKIVVDKYGNKIFIDSETEFIVTPDGFKFFKENGQYILTDYVGNEETIILPESINGHSYRIWLFRKGTHIIVPDSFTSISYSAFDGNKNLTTITIPDSITFIEQCAFRDCINLVNVNIPDSVTRISRDVFSGCSSLVSLEIPDSVLSIDADSFKGTGFYNNSDNWVNDYLIVDGWIVDMASEIEYIDYNNVRGIADNLQYSYMVKNPMWSENFNVYNTSAVTIMVNHLTWLPISSDIKTLKYVVIRDSVELDEIFDNKWFFHSVTDIIIFVEAEEEDLRWDELCPEWSNGNRVVYGDGWSWSNFYDENGKLIKSEPRMNHQVIIRPVVEDYEQDGQLYEFIGWDLDGDGLVDGVPATSLKTINAHAVYKLVHECNIVATVTPPSCTEMGYTTYICTICNEKHIADYVEATGHDFDEDLVCFTCGEHITGFVKVDGGTRYYFEDGSYAKNFTTIEGKTYYFGKDGILFEGISKTVGVYTYYFTEDHSTREGLIREDGGVRFYKGGVRQYGWADTDGNGVADSYFYVSTQLRCEEDRVLFDGKDARRFFKYNAKTGYMEIVNGFYTNENGTQFFKNGLGQYGWITADGVSITDRPGITLSNVHYFAYGDGINFYMVEDSVKKIGGVVREFDENHLAKAYTGWSVNKKTGNSQYYIQGVMQQGWCETPDGWVYLSRSQNLANNIDYGDAFYGWRKIGGKTYYFRAGTSTPAFTLITDASRPLTYNGVRDTYYVNQPLNPETATGADYYIINSPKGF